MKKLRYKGSMKVSLIHHINLANGKSYCHQGKKTLNRVTDKDVEKAKRKIDKMDQ